MALIKDRDAAWRWDEVRSPNVGCSDHLRTTYEELPTVGMRVRGFARRQRGGDLGITKDAIIRGFDASVIHCIQSSDFGHTTNSALGVRDEEQRHLLVCMRWADQRDQGLRNGGGRNTMAEHGHKLSRIGGADSGSMRRDTLPGAPLLFYLSIWSIGISVRILTRFSNVAVVFMGILSAVPIWSKYPFM